MVVESFYFDLSDIALHSTFALGSDMVGLGLRTVVEAATDGVILMDSRGIVTMFNPACERMFGCAADEIVGGDVRRLAPSLYDDFNRRLLSGQLSEYEGQTHRQMIGHRRNGETFLLDLSVSEGEHDGKAFFVSILRDLTETGDAFEKCERLIKRLAAANDELAAFAQIAAHDLREPLRMVTAFCGLLAKDYGDRLDERGREYLSLAVSASDRMSALLDDLVEFSGLNAENGGAAWFESDKAAQLAVENLGEAVRESKAHITKDPLPRIVGNPVRFSRLIQNLVENALKFVAPGVTPRIHITALTDSAFWRFSVSDNGVGVDSLHHDRIFEPFQRLHSSQSHGGAGLGLAICRKIADSFGGRIWVTSAPEGGAIFSFTVKRREPDDRLDG